MRVNLVIFILIFFSYFNFSYSENKIVFINLDEIINSSIAGKKFLKKTNKMQENILKEFTQIETDLKIEEDNIKKKKNIMEKSQYNKLINDFRAKINLYKKDKFNKVENLKNFKIKQTNNFLSQIAPILKDYSTENSISIILQKKDILIGNSKFDITSIIMKKVNKKIVNIENK